ncbi:MAG: LysE family transporter [Aquaticitalea sp.]
MNIAILFFLGFIIALVGVVPPGLLNMTAVKISLKEGHVRGLMYSIGVCVIVFLQTYIATMFARYLSNHQDVVKILQRVAFVIFVLITLYYLLIAKSDPKPNNDSHSKSKHSRFFQGMFLSAINFFPIPYQAYMTITLASFGWMDFKNLSIILYVLGSVAGTFVMLYIYILFFDKVKSKFFTSQKNINYFIGTITGLIAGVTLVHILMER